MTERMRPEFLEIPPLLRYEIECGPEQRGQEKTFPCVLKRSIRTTIGLTFEEYVDVKLRPQESAHRVFDIAAQKHASEMFPMSTVQAANHLRSRGYACRPASLEMLVETEGVSLAGSDRWMQADVDAAAEHFEQCESFVPYATMCLALGCRYVDFLRPLREASERESAKYGRHVPMDDQYFVLHRLLRPGHHW